MSTKAEITWTSKLSKNYVIIRNSRKLSQFFQTLNNTKNKIKNEIPSEQEKQT